MIQTCLIIASVWPEPKASAAGRRMMELIHVLRKKGMKIYFQCPAQVSDLSEDLKALGIECSQWPINDSSVDIHLKAIDPDLVIFDRFLVEEQWGWRIKDVCPNAIRVLNTEDLHSLRNSRQKAHKNKQEWSPEHWRADESLWRELGAILRCDQTWIISNYEQRALKAMGIPESLLVHLPFHSQTSIDGPGFHQRKHVMTIGNFKHAPNRDAVEWMVELWPKVREYCPELEFHVYGAYLDQKIKQLHQPKLGIHIMGWCEDVHSCMQKYRLVLAPLRFGAGQKGKILEAMECQTPFLSTALGLESMLALEQKNGLVENGDWPATIQKYVGDEDSWLSLKNQQQQGFKANFFQSNALENAFQSLEELHKNLNAFRNQNVLGNLMHFHQFRSTKFMSKWIESKHSNPSEAPN